MLYNLAELDADTKNRIEIDKQAAYFIWQLKQSMIGPDVISKYSQALRSDDDKVCFEDSINKYKKQMGVV
ncbi:DUF3283 family protein [Vibrio sp. RC27]